MACWGRGAQGGHLDFHTVPAPAVWSVRCFPWQVIYTSCSLFLSPCPPDERLREATGLGALHVHLELQCQSYAYHSFKLYALVKSQ